MKQARGLVVEQPQPGLWRWYLALAGAVLVGGAFFTHWQVQRADRAMRADLLDHARLVAGGINLDRVQALTGSSADAGTVDYTRLKEQLARATAAYPEARFVYLLGRRSDGAVIFLVDNEPPGSPDESPPGQRYSEMTEADRAVVAAERKGVVGPTRDRWGTWVTAWVPLVDQERGAWVAALGMDVDAAGWRQDQALAALLPASLSVAVLLATLLGGLVVALHRARRTMRAREARLCESQTRFDQFAKQSRTVHWEVDVDGRFTYASNVAAEVYGYTPEELVGRMYFYDLHPETGREAFKAGVFAAFTRQQRLTKLENPVLTKQGTVLWVSTNGLPRVDADGRLQGYRGSDTDISALKQAEQALRAERDFAESLLETTPTIILVLDRTGRIIRFNPYMEELSGYRLPEIRGADCVTAFVAQNAQETVRTRIAAVVQGVRSRNQVLPVLTKEGETRLIEWHDKPIRDADGTVTGVLVTGRDVTEQKQTEEQLRCKAAELDHGRRVALSMMEDAEAARAAAAAERQRLSNVIEATNVGTWEWNVQTGATVFNPRWAEMVGYSLAELQPTTVETWQHFMHPEDSARAAALLEEHFAGRSAYFGCEFRIRHRDGHWVWVHGRGRVVSWTADGQPEMMFGTHSDITDRKQAEEALRAKSAELERYFNSSLDLLCIADTEGRFLRLNPEWERVLGYPAAALQNQRFLDYVHPDDVPATVATMEQLAGQQDVLSFENRYRCADGSYRWIEWRSKSNGDLIYAAARDITDRKQAEQKLQAQAAFISLLLDAVPDLIFYKSLDGVYLGCNPSFAEFVGRPREAIIGHTDHDLFDAAVADSFRAHDAETMRFGAARHNEETVTYPDGRTVLLDTIKTPYGDGEGQPLGILGISRDITDRKRSEEQLQSAIRFQQTIIETAATAVFMVDVDQRITEVNDAFVAATGYSRDAIIGEHCCVLEGAPCRDQCGLFDPQRTRRIFRKQCTLQAADGRQLVVVKNAELVRDDRGEIVGGIESFVDVTELSQAREEALQLLQSSEAAKAKLEALNHLLAEQTARANSLAAEAAAANAAKSEFLANMSHEIRTPMTAILGFTEAARDACPRSCEFGRHEYLEYLDVVGRNGDYLIQLINDILDLSKIEAGKLTVEQIACAPAELVGEVESLVRVRSAAKGLDLRVAFENALPATIQSDPTRLRQILINLLGNAIKFTEVGHVTLTVRLVPNADTGPRLEFDVSDSGLGMTSDQADKLFQPFAQADTSTTRKFGGTGLGLTISKRLAEALGGDVRVVWTEPGAGSCFRLTVATGPLDAIPLVAAPRAQAAPQQAAPATTATPPLTGRVLLAEDGPDNQRLIAHLLKKAGATVTVVENGALAVDAALAADHEGTPFDLILMDMQMPVMDGYTATSTLRERGYRGAIVALTAHAMAADRQKCLDAGCDDYATKPIDRAQLVATLQTAMTRTSVDAGRHADGGPSDATSRF